MYELIEILQFLNQHTFERKKCLCIYQQNHMFFVPIQLFFSDTDTKKTYPINIFMCINTMYSLVLILIVSVLYHFVNTKFELVSYVCV